MADKLFTSIGVKCHAKATSNFVLGNKKEVGHLLGMTFTNCGKDLAKDMEFADPESPESLVEVVGVFDRIYWKGGPAEPIEFNVRVSETNKSTIQEALSSLTGGAEIEISWVIYLYDGAEKKYYKHFHDDNKKIKCVFTRDSEVEFGPELETDIESLPNFKVYFSLTGSSAGGKQEVSLAYTAKNKMQRRFGIAQAS